MLNVEISFNLDPPFWISINSFFCNNIKFNKHLSIQTQRFDVAMTSFLIDKIKIQIVLIQTVWGD